MIKPLNPRILIAFAFLAMTLTLSSVYLYAQPAGTPGDLSTSSQSNVTQIDTNGLFYSGAPDLVAQWHEEEREHEHHCVRHCRHRYEERLRECMEPEHEHHHRCKEWARERERECLEHCYREYPR